jgi:YHS domain-containing protein
MKIKDPVCGQILESEEAIGLEEGSLVWGFCCENCLYTFKRCRTVIQANTTSPKPREALALAIAQLPVEEVLEAILDRMESCRHSLDPVWYEAVRSLKRAHHHAAYQARAGKPLLGWLGPSPLATLPRDEGPDNGHPKRVVPPRGWR